MKISLKHRLLTRLLISHILLVSIPLIITGLVLIHTARQSIEKIVLDRNLEFARRAASNITETLKQATNVLKFNSENILNFRVSRLSREVLINNIVRDFDIFKEISILNASGEIEMSTHYVEEKNNFINRDFIQKTNNNESYCSEIFISEDKLPYMEFAEPISVYNEIMGILFAKVNLKVIWDVMDSSIVGQHGQALIFDRNGIYIAHSKRKKVYLKETFPDFSIINEISYGRSGHKVYTNRAGAKMIAAYVPLTMTKWGIVIQQPVNEAFAKVQTMQIQISIFVLSSILIASLIAYVYTRRIVRPVNQLISGVKRFSTGDLNYRITPLGKDEISTLTKQFNTMAVRLIEFQNKIKRIERFETLSKMASILSHEIKNPLNAMVINMEIQKKELHKKTVNRKKLEHYHHIVVSEITRVDKLVNNFLLLARPPKLQKTNTTIHSILNKILLEQREDSLQKNIIVRSRFCPHPIKILADKNRLKQAFLNIYINALQAMPDGGNLTINISLDNAEKLYSNKIFARITFTDSGQGISRKDMEHIFDFYYSTKKGGTGLGLAIAQQIIEEHDGTIKVETEKGIGTTFIISLPVN